MLWVVGRGLMLAAGWGGGSLGEGVGDVDVRHREVSGAAVDRAFVPIVVHLINQSYDVIFLKKEKDA